MRRPLPPPTNPRWSRDYDSASGEVHWFLDGVSCDPRGSEDEPGFRPVYRPDEQREDDER